MATTWGRGTARRLVLGTGAALGAVALLVTPAAASTVRIQDDANVLFDDVLRSRGDYPGAVRAAITSLHSSLASARGGGESAAPARSHGIGVPGTLLVIVVLLVVAGVLLAVFRGSRRRRTRYSPHAYGPGPYDDPGYGPNVGYGPGYGPSYGGSMGRGAAAGPGAVGGGLLGYELGRDAGEEEQFRRDELADGDSGDFGGDSGGGSDW